MKQFDFELFLLEDDYPSGLQADEFLDSVEDPLFDAFGGDVTPAVIGGVPTLYCTITGQSIGEALDKVREKIIGLGLHPSQILMRMEHEGHRRYA